MRILICGIILVVGNTGFACNDYSGEYVEAKSEYAWTLKQTGCKSFSIVTEIGDLTFATDGSMHARKTELKSKTYVVQHSTVDLNIWATIFKDLGNGKHTFRIRVSLISSNELRWQYWEDNYDGSHVEKDIVLIRK